jgi:hypothetical protein
MCIYRVDLVKARHSAVCAFSGCLIVVTREQFVFGGVGRANIHPPSPFAKRQNGRSVGSWRTLSRRC